MREPDLDLGGRMFYFKEMMVYHNWEKIFSPIRIIADDFALHIKEGDYRRYGDEYQSLIKEAYNKWLNQQILGE